MMRLGLRGILLEYENIKEEFAYKLLTEIGGLEVKTHPPETLAPSESPPLSFCHCCSCGQVALALLSCSLQWWQSL